MKLLIQALGTLYSTRGITHYFFDPSCPSSLQNGCNVLVAAEKDRRIASDKSLYECIPCINEQQN